MAVNARDEVMCGRKEKEERGPFLEPILKFHAQFGSKSASTALIVVSHVRL